MTSKTATAAAERIGARAGRGYVSTGIPRRNPFTGRPDLAAAWRRAYFAALRAAGRRRG